MPRIYMAIAQEDRHPVTDIMRQTPDLPEGCQWAIFLRNHDELTLEMVTDKERDYLWNFYAQERRMRINLGIRRRLAPLMGNDRPKIELMNALLLSLPGTPVMYYGDEIGMGDNIYLGDRDGVRTPMQWSPDRNGGFSRSDPARLYLPAIMDPVYGYGAVNVEAQTANASSLLHWTRRMLAIRQSQNVFGRGTLEFLYPSNRRVLAYLRSYEGRTVLCVFNLSRSAQAAQLDLTRLKGHTPVELLGRSAFPPIGELPYLVTLPAYGFFWFLLATDSDVPNLASGIPEPMPEFLTLVTRSGWRDMLAPPARPLLEREALPAFLMRQRWFAGKNDRIAGVTVLDACQLPGDETYVMARLGVALASGDEQRYLLPLAITANPENVGGSGGAISYMITQIRRGPRLEGVYDATAMRGFAFALLKAITGGTPMNCDTGGMRFSPTPALAELSIPPDAEVRRLGADQSNSSVLIADQVVVKVYRRLVAGKHPEIEFGEFLRDVGFANTPPLLGAALIADRDGETSGAAVVQGFVRNQGDGWAHALNHVQRMLDTTALGVDVTSPEVPDTDAYLMQIGTLGRRVAELHRALATPTDNLDFAPEPITVADLRRWKDEIRQEATKAFDQLAAVLPNLSPAIKPEADLLLDRREECLQSIDRLAEGTISGVKTRIHGDLHLGQVLVAQNDWYIIDFEGEPARDLATRRRKHAPLRDVAGMLRSFDYAAQAALQQAALTNASVPSQGALAQRWRDSAAGAFLAAYREVAAGSSIAPAAPSEAERLLQFFLLEKACYELSYEAANRPDWIAIPIRGVAGVLDAVRRP
jgi:maltose alpha-D-glucosyltransferase/alpha-amylase